MGEIIRDIITLVLDFLILLPTFGKYFTIIIILLLIVGAIITGLISLYEKIISCIRKINKKIIVIVFLIIIVISSLFYIPFRHYGIVLSPYSAVLDLNQYNTKEYYHFYEIPESKIIKIKPSGQLDFIKVEVKRSLIFKEFIIRYVAITIFIIIIFKIRKNPIKGVIMK